MVHEIKNKAEFDSALAANKDKLVVIDFSATWVSEFWINNLRDFHSLLVDCSLGAIQLVLALIFLRVSVQIVFPIWFGFSSVAYW